MKFAVIFTSMSGNTEEMADLVAKGAREAGAEVDQLDVLNVSSGDLEQYDGLFLGAYTWGDGELPDDFEDFYEELDSVNLEGKIAAAFGSGDTAYPQFCKAVEILEEKLTERGAYVAIEGLKIELAPEGEDVDRCVEFGKQLVTQFVNL